MIISKIFNIQVHKNIKSQKKFTQSNVETTKQNLPSFGYYHALNSGLFCPYRNNKYENPYTHTDLLEIGEIARFQKKIGDSNFSPDYVIKSLKAMPKDKKEEIAPFLINIIETTADDDFGSLNELLQQYSVDKISADELIQLYSTDKIKKMLSYLGTEEKISQIASEIVKTIEKGGSDCSDLTLIMDLIKEKKLSPAVLFYYSSSFKLTSEAKEDLYKLYDAYIEGKDVISTFVPEFKDVETALEKTRVGDVFKLQDDKNISIKMSDNDSKKLFMTSETYLELFPPFERYFICQGGIGDCFLVSTFENVYSNPLTRHKILEMYKSNDDGTVDICFGGYQYQNENVVQKDESLFELKDISSNIRDIHKKGFQNLAWTNEGLRAFEVLYEKGKEAAVKSIITQRYNFFLNLKSRMGDSDSVRNGDFVYEKEEIDFLLKLFENYFNNPQSNLLICLLDKNPSLAIKRNMIDKLTAKEFCNDEEKNYLENLKRRYNRYFAEHDETTCRFDEILNLNVYSSIFDNMRKVNPDILYLHSGQISEVFKLLGLNTEDPFFAENSLFDLLSLSEYSNKYLLGVSTAMERENTRFPLTLRHGYSVKVTGEGIDRKFHVKNPYNSAFEIELDMNDFLNHFDYYRTAGIT